MADSADPFLPSLPCIAPVRRPGGGGGGGGDPSHRPRPLPPFPPSPPPGHADGLRWWRRGSFTPRAGEVGVGQWLPAAHHASGGRGGVAAGSREPGGGAVGFTGRARARGCGGGLVWARPNLAGWRRPLVACGVSPAGTVSGGGAVVAAVVVGCVRACAGCCGLRWPAPDSPKLDEGGACPAASTLGARWAARVGQWPSVAAGPVVGGSTTAWYSSNNRCFVVCVKREFEFDRHLPASNWIVVRIDCCHFHRFVFQENTEYYIREMRGTHLILWISTVHVSNRRSLCEVEKIFPQQRISAPPHFDAEVLCYPKPKIVLDYLSWRQAECHNRRTSTRHAFGC